jgi:ketosteroid isomerase-like protein
MNDEGLNEGLREQIPAIAGVSTPGVEHADSLDRYKDVVGRLFEAFSKRELTDVLELLHPEILFRPMTAEVTQAGEPYRGHEGIRRYTADIEAQWDELTLHPTQIRAAGNAAVALGLVSGSGRAGAFENVPTTWIFRFRDGLVADVQVFSDARNVYDALIGGEDG